MQDATLIRVYSLGGAVLNQAVAAVVSKLFLSPQCPGSFLFMDPGPPRPVQKLHSCLLMRLLGPRVLVGVWVFMIKPSSGSRSTGE